MELNYKSLSKYVHYDPVFGRFVLKHRQRGGRNVAGNKRKDRYLFVNGEKVLLTKIAWIMSFPNTSLPKRIYFRNRDKTDFRLGNLTTINPRKK
jgi:hypothetical protein